MSADESGMIGYRIRLVRERRGKGLRVIAGLAGMHYSTLSRIERGEHPITVRELYAIADALQVSTADLTRLSLPAPANGHTDTTIKTVRSALDAVEDGLPGGLVLPLDVLRDQVTEIHRQRRDCLFAEVATALPGLIRNLHTTLATGTDRDALLDLSVYLHVQVTRLWLAHAAAPTDLVRRVVFLVQRLARERDDVTTLALASFGVARELLSGAEIEQARAKLGSITLPPTTTRTAGLAGQVTAVHARLAALAGHHGDADAATDTAADLVARFGIAGEVDAVGSAFGALHLAIHQIWLALEADDPDRAVMIAQDVNPERYPFPVNQAHYWMYFGRALARLPKRRADAVRALRRAEQIFPTKVLRDAKVRDTLAYLMLTKSIPGEAGQELRAMTRRAGIEL